MRFLGLDLHKHALEVCALDRQGKRLFRLSVDCQRPALEQFAREYLRKTDAVAVEATTNTWAVVDILRPFVARIVVSNPLQTKAIAQAKVKTDKIDAYVLAQLLRCDYLPEVWHPDAATQQLRHLTTVRSSLVGDRTRIKNRIQSLRAGLLITPPFKVLFTKQGLAWLREVPLPQDARLTVNSHLRLLEAIEGELAELDVKRMQRAHDNAQLKLLMTLPGVAHGVALTLLAALGDLSRFKDGDHAARYLGLVPSTRQSARRCSHGPITKAGCSQTRALLTQAAQHAADHPGPLGAFFRRLRKRKSRNVAIVATARKLVTIALLMLKNNEPYRYARPETVKPKLAEIRRQGGGQPSKPGPQNQDAKASPLNTIYEREGLPAATEPGEWPVAEQRVLEEAGVLDFAQEMHRPRPKAGKKPTKGSAKPSRQR